MTQSLSFPGDPIDTAQQFAAQLSRESVAAIVAGVILGVGFVATVAVWWFA